MSFIGAAIGGGVAALAGGIGSAISGGIQAGAAKDAASIQAQSARDATAMQEKMYNQTRADQQPWREAGTKALSDLGNADFQKDFSMADYQADPGYAFRMAEGQKALERSAAAKGLGTSGGALRAASRYSQDMASQEYGNAYNRFNSDRDRRFGRLSSIAGMGQQATNQSSAANQHFGDAAAGNITGAGNAQAAGRMGEANAWSGAVSGITGAIGEGIGSASGLFGKKGK